MVKDFNLENATDVISDISSKNILEHIHSYNDEMTISQVVKFFEKHGISITKTIIQNYVRVNVLPTHVNKRYYTKNHLVLITIIEQLKTIYSLEEIRQIFSQVIKEFNSSNYDYIDICKIYDYFLNITISTLNYCRDTLPKICEESKLLFQDESSEQEKDEKLFFVNTLTLMAQSVAAKQITQKFIENFFHENNKKPVE